MSSTSIRLLLAVGLLAAGALSIGCGSTTPSPEQTALSAEKTIEDCSDLGVDDDSADAPWKERKIFRCFGGAIDWMDASSKETRDEVLSVRREDGSGNTYVEGNVIVTDGGFLESDSFIADLRDRCGCELRRVR